MGILKVSEPLLDGNEKKYLCQAIDEGEVSSEGRFVRMFEEAFAKWAGTRYAIAVSSGSAALETAIWAYGMEEIWIPAGTIISCYAAAKRAGAQKIKLYDNGDRITGKNVMRCHLFGIFDYGPQGETIIEDCSQYWTPIEVTGAACYSLYANKLITSGEGGVIVTNNPRIYFLCRQYRNLCHSSERFVHFFEGFNYRMSNLQAAVALAQLERIDEFMEIKRENQRLYLQNLPEGEPIYFSHTLYPWMHLVRTRKRASVMVRKMEEKGIDCRRFFLPLHRQPCLPYTSGNYPVSERLWNYSFYLPSGLTLKKKDILRVCKALREILQPV